jgi:hypothetical protein
MAAPHQRTGDDRGNGAAHRRGTMATGERQGGTAADPGVGGFGQWQSGRRRGRGGGAGSEASGDMRGEAAGAADAMLSGGRRTRRGRERI